MAGVGRMVSEVSISILSSLGGGRLWWGGRGLRRGGQVLQCNREIVRNNRWGGQVQSDRCHDRREGWVLKAETLFDGEGGVEVDIDVNDRGSSGTIR